MSGFHPKDLIKEVKIRPGIYNKDELVHPKREHKHLLWMEVAERLTPAEDWESYTEVEKEARMDEISTKWKHLKDHFYREIKLQEAGEAHKKRKYIYFDDLQFVRPFVGFRLQPACNRNKSSLPLDNTQDYIDHETDIDMDAFLKSAEQVEEDGEYKMEPDDSQPDIKPELKNVATPLVKTLHHKTNLRQNVSVNKNFNELKKPNNIATNPYFKIRDGDISFSLSLVPALRKLDDSLKLRAKVDILRVLEGCVDHVEQQNSTVRLNLSDHNTTNTILQNPDIEYMPEDHLDYLDEYEESVNVKHELHDDPLNGSGANNKTWWT